MAMSDTSLRIPTFFLLGAPKCGTTSLAFYLGQHPDVCFSEPKEPTFFEAEYEKGLAHYRARYFAGWRGERAAGEGRVWHLYLPFVAPRIRESFPDARLLAILRDPVERAHSHWWHRHSRGQETLSFEDAVARDRARIERGETFEGEDGERRWRAGLYRESFTSRLRVLLDPGFYAEQLERYLRLFPQEQLKVLLYEDLAADPTGLLRDVYAFVGVDPDHRVSDVSERNVGRDRVRGPMARRLSFGARALGLRHLVPTALRRGARARLLPEREARRPPLRDATRGELVSFFEPHTARLEALLGRDLASWRGGPRRS